MPRPDRDALLDSDAPAADVAVVLKVSPQRVRQLRAARGDQRRAGRPRSKVVTGESARGRALLARLTEIAVRRGVEPEALLDEIDR